MIERQWQDCKSVHRRGDPRTTTALNGTDRIPPTKFVAGAIMPADLLQEHVCNARAEPDLWGALNEASALAERYDGTSWHAMGHSAQVKEQIQALRELLLRPELPVWRTICEVGFNAGHSAITWLHGTSAQLKEFDLFQLPYSAGSRAYVELLYPGRVTFYSGNSAVTLLQYVTQVAAGVEPPCDLWFIDGDHRKAGAVRDFRNAMASSSELAWVVADDCTSRYPAVRASFDNYVNQGHILRGTVRKTTVLGGRKGWCIGQVNHSSRLRLSGASGPAAAPESMVRQPLHHKTRDPPPAPPSRLIRFALVSFAHGRVFEKSMATMAKSARAAGFDATFLGSRTTLRQDEVFHRYPAAMEVLDKFQTTHGHQRPFCDAFKPIMLRRAMKAMREGDYVMWADASRYHIGRLEPLVHSAAGMLRRKRASSPAPRRNISKAWSKTPWYIRHSVSGWTSRAVRSAYGIIHCSSSCARQTATTNGAFTKQPAGQVQMVDARTLRAYSGLLGTTSARSFLARPHVQATNLLLENTAQNRELVWDWLMMALARPDGFCHSHVQDQAAWTILVQNHSLPLINTCPFAPDLQKGCAKHFKSMNAMLRAISSGMYEVVEGTEYDLLK